MITRDRGVGLIEVVLAIAITGGVVVAILGALSTVVRSADQSSNATKVQAIVGGAADELAGAVWVACPEVDDAYLGAVGQAAGRVGWPSSTVRIDDIDYWNPSANNWTEECNGAAAVGTSERLQRVTITVTAPNESASKSFDLIKSDTNPFAVEQNDG